MNTKPKTYEQGYSDGYDRGYIQALENIKSDVEHRAAIAKEAMAEDKAVEYGEEDW